MGAKLNNVNPNRKVMTIQKLNELLPQLNCPREQAIKIAAEYGLPHAYADILRTILGFSAAKLPNRPKEVIDEIIRIYEDNSELSAYQIYRQHGKRLGIPDYQTIYSILRQNGIETNRKHCFWTPIKDKRLIYMKEVLKYTYKQCAEYLGKTYSTTENRYRTLKGLKRGQSIKDIKEQPV